MGVFFRVEDDGELSPLRRAADGSLVASSLSAAADVDGDGDIDFVATGNSFDQAILIQEADSIQEASYTDEASHFCPC
jgi:hypothetical protein